MKKKLIFIKMYFYLFVNSTAAWIFSWLFCAEKKINEISADFANNDEKQDVFSVKIKKFTCCKLKIYKTLVKYKI